MAKFPVRRADKDALYARILAGVAANPAEFPSGAGQPFDTAALTAGVASKDMAVAAMQEAIAQARIAVEEANRIYAVCDQEAKRLLNTGVAIHGRNSAVLAFIGYRPSRSPVREAPGSPRVLEAVRQGPGELMLDWKSPGAVGGRVSFYRVIRQKRSIGGVQVESWGAWQVTTTATEFTLTDLERGVEYDFAVVAVNASGESLPSNTVSVVL